MIKTTIGIFSLAAFFALGCADSGSPTGPPPRQPTPGVSLAPVVRSVTRASPFSSQWVIHGSNLTPEPEVTFESGTSVIRLASDNFSDDYVVAALPPATAPGAYTPCVRTVNGKGCGSFLVTVTR